MDRNAKKQGKMQVFFPYAILVFQIFCIGEIQQRKKEPHYFVQSRSEAKLYKQLSTEKLFIWIWRITTWNPKLGIWKGRLKLHFKVFLFAIVFGYGKGNKAIKRNNKE